MLVEENISGGEETSLSVIYSAVYESTSYTAMAVQELEGKEYFMTSVLPPVHFGEDLIAQVYVQVLTIQCTNILWGYTGVHKIK